MILGVVYYYGSADTHKSSSKLLLVSWYFYPVRTIFLEGPPVFLRTAAVYRSIHRGSPPANKTSTWWSAREGRANCVVGGCWFWSILLSAVELYIQQPSLSSWTVSMVVVVGLCFSMKHCWSWLSITRLSRAKIISQDHVDGSARRTKFSCGFVQTRCTLKMLVVLPVNNCYCWLFSLLLTINQLILSRVFPTENGELWTAGAGRNHGSLLACLPGVGGDYLARRRRRGSNWGADQGFKHQGFCWG